MFEKVKGHQRILLIILIIICKGSVVAGEAPLLWSCVFRRRKRSWNSGMNTR